MISLQQVVQLIFLTQLLDLVQVAMETLKLKVFRVMQLRVSMLLLLTMANMEEKCMLG